jgi:hypothetical protein
MSTSTNERDNAVGGLARHAVYEGAAALLVAVVHLVLLRGVSVGLLQLFVAPPLAAFLLLQRSTAKGVRRLALAFLLLVALGAVVAPFPAFLPRLGGVDQRLPVESDRLLTWYVAVYLLFFMGILPTCFFVTNLRRHWRGEPATVSRFTCYLGLLPLAMLWPMLPVLLGALLGLWPMHR